MVAITADTRDMQAQLNIIWEKLLPAFQAAPLPKSEVEHAKLKQILSSLTVRSGHTNNVIKLPGTADAPKKN